MLLEIRIIGAFVSLDVSRIPSKYPDLTYVYLDLSRLYFGTPRFISVFIAGIGGFRDVRIPYYILNLPFQFTGSFLLSTRGPRSSTEQSIRGIPLLFCTKTSMTH